MNLYLLRDPNEPEWLKLGETTDPKNRLITYNTGSRGKQKYYVETWDIPPTMGDRHFWPHLSDFDRDGEWFRVSEDEAVEILDAAVDSSGESHDPDYVQKTVTLADVEVDDVDWSMVEIDQMTPEAADLIIDRFKQGLYVAA